MYFLKKKPNNKVQKTSDNNNKETCIFLDKIKYLPLVNIRKQLEENGKIKNYSSIF